jgi:hypothetical protein
LKWTDTKACRGERLRICFCDSLGHVPFGEKSVQAHEKKVKIFLAAAFG